MINFQIRDEPKGDFRPIGRKSFENYAIPAKIALKIIGLRLTTRAACRAGAKKAWKPHEISRKSAE